MECARRQMEAAKGVQELAAERLEQAGKVLTAPVTWEEAC